MHKITTIPSCCAVCNTDIYSSIVAEGWDFEYSSSDQLFALMQCQNCRLIYLRDKPDRASLNIIYPKNYYSFSESSAQSHFVGRIRKMIEKHKALVYRNLIGDEEQSVNVYDVGCGDGRLLDILRNACPVSWTYSGIEIGEQAASKARAKGYSVEVGNFEDASIQPLSDSFDLVLLHQVLEHTSDPQGVISKIRMMLKESGIVSIETPDTNSWDRTLFKSRYWGGYHIPRHFYLFNQRSLTYLLQQVGFEIISCRSMLSPVFWIHSLHNCCVDHKRMRSIAGFFHYQNPFLLALFSAIDLVQMHIFHSSSNMQILARKKG